MNATVVSHALYILTTNWYLLPEPQKSLKYIETPRYRRVSCNEFGFYGKHIRQIFAKRRGLISSDVPNQFP